MITITQLTELLGWASVLNIGYLLLASLIVIVMKRPLASIHSKLLGIDEKDLAAKYFDFLSNYKVITVIFMVAPYFALKIMGY